MIYCKPRKNSEKPPSVILYWWSDVGIMRPSFISIQESCKYPGFLVDLCSAYRIKDTAPDWQRTGGKSYQISGTAPDETARKISAAFYLAISLIFWTSEKSPLFIAVMTCFCVALLIMIIFLFLLKNQNQCC